MVENKSNGPVTYDQWIDLGRVVIPCLRGKPVVNDWSNPNFKITKEEWKQKYLNHEIALRLDEDIDFDIDNPLVKRFIGNYIKDFGNVFGRNSNPTSHFIWKGKSTFKQFILPAELKEYCKIFPHGSTLCEIRTDSKHYTIVPGSRHSKAPETVTWEKYNNLNEYPGNLNNDLRKVALSTALCILYAPGGSRDAYCTAIAGALLKHTEWSEEEINEFIYNIAIAANDDEADKRKSKGTSGKKAGRKFGLPKLAEIIGCSTKAISDIFSWIGVQQAVSEEARQSIGDIIEYGSDRYIVKINAVVQGEPTEKEIIVDGPTLMNMKLFYDAVISKASVWIPKMKAADFETIMRRKFEAREKSKNYVSEAEEDSKFIKHFSNYITEVKAYTNKKELALYGMPYFNTKTSELDFKLDKFEDYLQRQKVNLPRVDLVLKIQRILKAIKNRGKYNSKSCVSWTIKNHYIEQEDLIVEGEYEEIENERT
tara:strand:+ start:172 stop:1614 length:1443 start_codon:yes stop_codon:yes gene_type:complete